MTGMLGELSAYLTHGDSIGNMSLTGTTADTMIQENGEVIGLGESFKDLTFLFNGKAYGINVKRYTSSEQDKFNLYRDDKGVGINSQYMYRYFNKDEVNLMRFIALNKDFIVEGLSKETEA
jgi:TPP-dependent trihydroxycyclohexane-1,2-dione (THcHDO) dehydratase